MNKKIGMIILMVSLVIFAAINITSVNAELKAVKYLTEKYPECKFIKAKRVLTLDGMGKYIRVEDEDGVEFTVTLDKEEISDYYEDMLIKKELEDYMDSENIKKCSVVVIDGEKSLFIDKSVEEKAINKCKNKFDNVYIEESVN
ncbi:MAG: hypothetical protein N4A47_06205 [Clostridia bacterium]|jgi:hypothetical protein|nr:hypothetical protein [Clostridia bacterium]